MSRAKSQSRLNREEEERIRAGGEVQPRKKKKAEATLAALVRAESPSSVAKEHHEEERVEFVYTDHPDEGVNYQAKRETPSQPLAKQRGKRGAADKQRGSQRKIRSNVVIHGDGDLLVAKDGRVKINLSKFICRPLTASDIVSKEYARLTDTLGKALEAGEHWECLLHSYGGANAKHPRFFRVGENTGNLKKHTERFHEELLQGCARVVEEYPAAEAEEQLVVHIRNMKVPEPKCVTDFFAARRKKLKLEDVRLETRALIWFLDGQIAFAQFDNEYFKEFMAQLNVAMPSRSTLVSKVIPLIYDYCISMSLEFLRSCASYTTSYDGWSRFGKKFVSQNYHCISPASFEYHIVCLDMCAYHGPQFAELLAGTMAERRKHWTTDLDLLAASLIADYESKGQAAGKLIFGEDDTLGCQNHRLKKVYEVGEANSASYSADFNALATLASTAANYGNVDKVLRRYQFLNDLDSLHFTLFNDTRWESRYNVVKRGVELRESLVGNEEMHSLACVTDIREDVEDFLEDSYFDRLEAYLEEVLEPMNDVSTFYQTQKFPTGCYVVLMSRWLYERFESFPNRETGAIVEMKDAFRRAVKDYLWTPVSSECNNFLKAGMLHPGVAPILRSIISDDVWDDCCFGDHSLQTDAAVLDEDGDVSFFDPAFVFYRKKYADVKKAMPKELPWDTLKRDGSIGGFSALGFWANAVDPKSPKFKEDKLNKLAGMVGVAAMLLSIPAGSSVDEFTFSSSQRTLSKERNAMSVTHVEQVTVIRMFIRAFGLSPMQLDEWMAQALEEQDEREKSATK